jgi:surface antigen
MRAGSRAYLIAVTIGLLATAAPPLASAATVSSSSTEQRHRPAQSTRVSTRPTHASSKHSLSKTAKAQYHRYAGISCVPFARAASGIELKGNAVNWWDAAAGVYERGSRPEVGAVLNFRATGGMRLGHVAVVTDVISGREIEIDHANWGRWGGKGNVSRGVRVIDVSAANDWSEVRVELGHSGEFGSAYPTYGFIYDRPDNGTMVANTAPVHPLARRPALDADEVAEAPAVPRPIPVSSGLSLPVDAPSHSLR